MKGITYVSVPQNGAPENHLQVIVKNTDHDSGGKAWGFRFLVFVFVF